MKLFRHYKNKLYTFLDTVRHSETGEEFALYETRYESPGGRTWVRPKEMFFESIVHDGRTQARFQPLELEVRCVTKISADDLAIVARLGEATLGTIDATKLSARLHKPLLVLGLIEGEPVAFKLGYEDTDGVFYSWLGGVHPEYRGLAYGATLLQAQHGWALGQGYARVRTKTLNRWRAMLLLNIREGFEITGTEPGPRGLKIVLEKVLAAPTTPK